MSCDEFCRDRLEVEFPERIDPERMEFLHLSSAPTAAFAPLANVLTQINGTMEASVGSQLARQTGLSTVFTIHFPPDRFDLARQLLAAIQASPPEGSMEILNIARVSSGKPANDAWSNPDKSDIDAPCGVQSHLRRIGAGDAWKCSKGSGVTVVVVDFGFVRSHVELDGLFDPDGISNTCEKDVRPIVENEHSSHGASNLGLVAARQEGEGIQGLAHGAKVVPVQGTCATRNVNVCHQCWGKGNPWAASIANVVATTTESSPPTVLLLETQTCCDGNYEGSPAVHEAIKAAVAKGIHVVVPAGNGCRDASVDDEGRPIGDTGSILVAAASSADDNALTVSSNFGDRITVSAPGERLLTVGSADPCIPDARPERSYTVNYGGTSGASAIVAGVVALMLEKNPSLTPAEVVAKLKETGSTVGGDRVGGVFLNAAGAVAAADPGQCKTP